MATSVLKVAFMVFFVLVICAILLVPIALMVTLEDKEEQKSTVPLSKLKKTTEEPMAKTASPTTTETSEPPPILGGGGAGLPPILGGGGAGLPPMLGGGGAGLPPLLGGGGAGLPPMPEISTELGPNDNSGLQCTDIFVTGSWKSSPPMPMDGTCNPAYIGDGYCDGPCNAPDNNFDQGDCCSTSITFDYCNYDDCECYCFNEGKQYYEESNIWPPPGIFQSTTDAATDDSGPLTCSNTFTQNLSLPVVGESPCFLPYIGDGHCDGACNIPEHDYDEGDCCLTTMNYHYCSYDDCECYCYPEDKQYEESICGWACSVPEISTEISELKCTNSFESESWKSSPPMLLQYSFCHPDYIGDSYCDGPCNIPEHNYDEGDCCSPFVTFHYCNYDDCECYCYPEDQQYVNTNNGLPTIMPPTAISFTF